MKIDYYKTNIGIIAKCDSGIWYNSEGIWYNSDKFLCCGVSTENAKKLNKGWFLFENKCEAHFQRISTKPASVVGYELINKSLASNVIPFNLNLEDVEGYFCDEDEIFKWKNYEDIRSLYKELKSESIEELVVVDSNFLGDVKIENINSPLIMKVHYLAVCNEKTQQINFSQCVDIDSFYEIVSPEFLSDQLPCSIKGEILYKIVRQFIKDNIAPNQARITSDYDFCFTVKKVIKCKPFTSSIFTGKKLKESKITKTEKLETVYEIAPKAYQNYPVMKGMSANNLEELYNMVLDYCNEITSAINKPVQECPCCNGLGYNFESKGSA